MAAELPAPRIARLAARALAAEARAAPKPGLVVRLGRGSHEDMELGSFLASARALEPHFAAMARAGAAWAVAAEGGAGADAGAADADDAGAAPRRLLESLRPLGLAAERDMFAATGGVNTHKGAIFSMGLLCGASGALCAAPGPARGAAVARLHLPSGDRRPLSALVCLLAAQACSGIVERELGARDGARGASEGAHEGARGRRGGEGGTATAGERLHRATGSGGIRGEAAAGFPAVLEAGLPALRRARRSGAAAEAAAVTALLALMARVEDSCVFSRAGLGGLAIVKGEAARLLRELEASGYTARGRLRRSSKAALLDFGSRLEGLRASPGGSADLLAVCLFLDALDSQRAEGLSP